MSMTPPPPPGFPPPGPPQGPPQGPPPGFPGPAPGFPGPPPGSYGGDPYGRPKVPNHMVVSIVATICGCLPAGIAAIVFSSQASSKEAAGDYAGAMAAARKAKTAWIVAFATTALFALLSVVLVVILAVAGQDVEDKFDDVGISDEGTDGLFDDEGTTEDTTGDTSGVEEDIDVFDVAVGDCLDGFYDSSDNQVESVKGVPCDTPHDVEISHLFDLPDGDFPGEDFIDEAGVVECEAAFANYVGIAYDESEFSTSAVLYPTEASWVEDGDREVVCGVGLPDEKLSESVMGAAR